MPKRRGTRLVAQRLLEATAQENDLDYFGQFTKRAKLNGDTNGQESTSNAPQKKADDRAARLARREAAKLGETQRTEEDDEEDESDGAAEDENEDEDEDDDADEYGGPDGVDLDRITQAINQARNRTKKPTINGIGARRRDQHEDTEESSDDGESSNEGIFVSQSSDGDEVDAPRNVHDKSRSRHGASKEAPQKSQIENDGTIQNNETRTSAHNEDEGGAESASEIESEIAEDSVFVEAPRRGETPVTVKVVINSMGGIFKTLQHQAWTGSIHWNRAFETDNDDDGNKTCATASGTALMKALQGLNDVLEEATNTPQGSSEDELDFTTVIAYLRTNSADVQQHFARINQTVDRICSREMVPPPPAAGEIAIARVVKTRQALLRDISRRLIPMLLVSVKKASGICPSEDNRSKTTLHLDCFALQFFLRPLAWTSRLHKALQRGFEQWPQDNDSQNDANDPEEGGSEAEESKKNAHSILKSQLDTLYSSVKKAEREIQDIAEQAERQKREVRAKHRNQGRLLARQQLNAEARQREQEEQRMRDEKQFQAFLKSTRALRNKLDPLKQLWDQSQADLPVSTCATYRHGAAGGGSSSGRGQRIAGAARLEGGPSRKDRVEVISDSDSDDPFSENYQPPAETPVANRDISSNGRPQNHLLGSGSSRPASYASNREWSQEEDKAMIVAIRYKGTYDVVSMARKLQRSQDDVARKATFLKQGYCEAYARRGVEIPAWAR
ncbi:hypothetical protein Daus18300_003077 [Diaporthe australafricana]|uniref:Myb-like domain-containing protein n=1 Tax=Diaporthe australafricana TaxID=127596 RepID=A0ABR3XIV5_9PEZI